MVAVGHVSLYNISQPLPLPLLPFGTSRRYNLVGHHALPQYSSTFTSLVLGPMSVLQSMAIDTRCGARLVGTVQARVN